MGGGFNVGINAVGFNKVIYNDINFAVANILGSSDISSDTAFV